MTNFIKWKKEIRQVAAYNGALSIMEKEKYNDQKRQTMYKIMIMVSLSIEDDNIRDKLIELSYQEDCTFKKGFDLIRKHYVKVRKPFIEKTIRMISNFRMDNQSILEQQRQFESLLAEVQELSGEKYSERS